MTELILPLTRPNCNLLTELFRQISRIGWRPPSRSCREL